MNNIMSLQKFLKKRRYPIIITLIAINLIFVLLGGITSIYKEIHHYILSLITILGGIKLGSFVFLFSIGIFIGMELYIGSSLDISYTLWFSFISVTTILVFDLGKRMIIKNFRDFMEQNKQLNEQKREKEELYNKLENQAEEMKLFYQMSLDLATCRDQEQINKGLINWVGEVISSDCAAIYVKEGDKITMRKCTPDRENFANSFITDGGEQYILRLITSNLPVIENNPRFNLLLKNKMVVAELSIEAIIAVPITVKGKNNGVLVLFNEEDSFTKGDMDKLITMANHSATVLEVAILNNEKSDLFYQTLTSLAAAIDAKDSYTKGHSEKVTYYAKLMGEELGLSPKQMEALEYASLLHDIGKIGIPDAVLNKPGRLNNEEYEIIRKHPNLSYYIVKDIDFLNETLDGIRYHHERMDGNGYPDGLKGKEIPVIARILSIADAFDAMTSHRIYSRARTVEMSLAELKKCAGSQFDPELVDSFVKALERQNLHKV